MSSEDHQPSETPRPKGVRRSRSSRLLGYVVLTVALSTLVVLVALLRLAVVTDYMYHAAVKDPERTPPEGSSIVAPADGTVLYVVPVEDGVIPEVIKRGVRVPMVELTKREPLRPFRKGYLIGIYMNTFGVHINRIPNTGRIVERTVWNGPHLDMTEAEAKIILREMVPGLVSLRKMLGLSPHGTENDHDFVLKSARETVVLEDERGTYLYIVRIADYWVGKILSWVHDGESVERGQRMGMITWGSQTDLFIEETPGMQIEVRVGDYVYGGETVLATY